MGEHRVWSGAPVIPPPPSNDSVFPRAGRRPAPVARALPGILFGGVEADHLGGFPAPGLCMCPQHRRDGAYRHIRFCVLLPSSCWRSRAIRP